jgi:pyridoxamine 5'-phosphate oxidase
MSETPYNDPYEWFEQWFGEAKQTAMANPDAVAVATVSPEGRPSIRQVLLKSFDRRGFVFYTNYRSPKAEDLDNNPQTALNFYWRGLERQIRIEGIAERLSAKESDAYFATRPRGSQIGAWASEQSAPLQSRQVLAGLVEQYEAEFAGKEVPRPDHWGGFRVVPLRFEFWEAEAYRLHDRWEFVRQEPSQQDWTVRMLYP